MVTETENPNEIEYTEEAKNELPMENKAEDKEINQDLATPVIEIQVVFSLHI